VRSRNYAIPILLACATAAYSQTRLDAAKAEPAFAASYEKLNCSVHVASPQLDFRFVYAVAVKIRVEVAQVQGAATTLNILLKIRAANGAPPVYLADSRKLTVPPDARGSAEFETGFAAGEGLYQIDVLARDGASRACHASSKMTLKPASLPGGLRDEMPANVAAPIASPVFAETKPGGAPQPLTIVINAAPLRGQTTAAIPDGDAWILSDAASTLLRELANGPARVIVVSLAGGREMLRLDAAGPEQADAIARAIAAAPQTTVDYSHLKSGASGPEFFENLLSQEMAADSARTIVIIGPPTQLRGAIPEAPLPAFEGRIFALQFVPIARREISGVRPPILYPHTREAPGYITPITRDPVNEIVSRAHGRTMFVASPAELARAISEIRKH
jgi:hypothetical protein